MFNPTEKEVAFSGMMDNPSRQYSCTTSYFNTSENRNKKWHETNWHPLNVKFQFTTISSRTWQNDAGFSCPSECSGANKTDKTGWFCFNVKLASNNLKFAFRNTKIIVYFLIVIRTWMGKYKKSNHFTFGADNQYVVGQLSSRTRHCVPAVAALDKSLSMGWWRWHISVSQLCSCWSMAVSFWVASIIVCVCFGVPPRECRSLN